ncbi:hypothetical protein ABT297_35110 [Dactylosporangium sp. NPDC000555]|uniref:hypothetical protein n=1 Tax=Dactylosporangium sp. NPDC000555 TaxID=3154260 RepID=UPI003332D71F
MSFSAYASLVRCPTPLYRHRLVAFRSCVQLYQPIGFHASLSYLEAMAGPFERDEAALLRALDILCASRAAWHAALREYAAQRRAAKRRGQRSPHPNDPNPSHFPGFWYGAPRQAAVHALTFWRRDRLPALLASSDPIAAQVDSCVTAFLAAGGSLTPDQRQHLTDAVDALQRRLQTGLRHDDEPAYVRTVDLLRVAWLVRTAADTAESLRTRFPITEPDGRRPPWSVSPGRRRMPDE